MNAPALLHAEQSGPEDAPALVFLHGFLGDRRDWTYIAGSMAQSHRCIVLDLPGHGQSASREIPESFDAAVDLIDATLEACGAATCTLAGYSMGGRLALGLALRHPQRVRALVLESASPGIESEADRTARATRDDGLADRIEREGLPAFIRFWYDQPLFAGVRRQPALHAELLHSRRQGDGTALAHALRALTPGRQKSHWSALTGLACPTLLLTGTLDATYTSIARRILSLLPQGRWTEIPEAGHAVHREQPFAYLRELGRFLAAEDAA